MKTLDYLHLDASAVSNVVASLKQLLADYQVFYTNLRGFHWNIKGHGFFVLHGKFEDMYNNAAEKVDELAERILMLGGEPENKFSEYLKVARVKEVSGVSCGDEALKHILDTYGLLIGEERKLLSLASEAGDEATVALMSDYLKEDSGFFYWNHFLIIPYNLSISIGFAICSFMPASRLSRTSSAKALADMAIMGISLIS